MKTPLFFAMMLTAAFVSCTKSRYATVGAYENDEAYYTADENFISDFALVDDEAQMAAKDSSSSTSSSDDYYDPNYAAPQVYSPNSYASNYSPNPWNGGYNACSNFNGCGYGGYSYGSYWNCSPYFMPSVGWNPYTGYYSSFNMGYNSFYNPYYNSYASFYPYNSWYTPYYSPFYYSGWAYNPYYSPYNYYSSNNNDNSTGGIIHGARNPLATMSGVNSSYSTGLFYNGSKRNAHTFVSSLQTSAPSNPAQVSRVPQSSLEKPAVNQNNRPTYKPSAQRPLYTLSTPARNRDSGKPGLTKPREVSPARENNRTIPSYPRSGKEYSPHRQTPVRESNPSAPSAPSSRPRLDAPRTTPRVESSPTRSSGSSPAPMRSSGGSTNSPRRK